jgi:histidine triad (HIT) family protein
VHEPPGYACPFCRLLDGVETERNRLDDVVSRGERTTAFVSPKWWPANPGAAIVIPNAHVENLYEVDDDLLGDELYGLQAQSRWVAPEERAGYSAQLRAALGRV